MIYKDTQEIRNSTTKNMSMNKLLFYVGVIDVFIYRKLTISGNYELVTSANMKVGDIIKVHQNQRIPADMILLYTTEKNGSVFIRTD